jgi:hypothetical protein
MDDLQKYGNLKLAIQKLEDQKRKKIILKSNKKIKSKSEPKKGKIINKTSTSKEETNKKFSN